MPIGVPAVLRIVKASSPIAFASQQPPSLSAHLWHPDRDTYKLF